jgi:hypothetical protein
MSNPTGAERAEWSRLNAEDLAAAVEERLAPEQQLEHYDDPLSWEEWLRSR